MVLFFFITSIHYMTKHLVFLVLLFNREKLHIKVSDFGLAKKQDKEEFFGSQCGTPNYGNFKIKKIVFFKSLIMSSLQSHQRSWILRNYEHIHCNVICGASVLCYTFVFVVLLLFLMIMDPQAWKLRSKWESLTSHLLIGIIFLWKVRVSMCVCAIFNN